MEEEKEVKEEEIEEAELAPQPKEEEDIESLPTWAQERLKKEAEEKENYKKGMLQAKKRSLTPEKEEEKEEEFPDWDDNSKQFQRQTEAKAAKIAEQKANEIIASHYEQSAINAFIEKHPEYNDDAKWKNLLSNFRSSSKESVAAITKDIEKAHIITKIDNGDITNLELEAYKKGKAKGMIDSKIADLSAVNKDSSKANNQAVLSDQQKIAQRLAGDLPPGFSIK